MSSSAINAQLFQAKIGSIQNQADSSSVYSNGVWSFKNSTAVPGVTITDSGNVGIGTASPAQKLQVNGSVHSISGNYHTDTTGGYWASGNGSFATGWFESSGSMVFRTATTERMRIDASGSLLVFKTSADDSTTGFAVRTGGGSAYTSMARSGGAPLYVNRTTNDGALVEFAQDSITEGSISVSGTTVSYNGAHLTRWSQLPSGTEKSEILRGSVLSNVDEMCFWEGEDNEQLNRMKISDIEGDKNVAGVFQDWDSDEDFYCAMTGDFVIRIAKDVKVERGDLLMSAGDGTAKPQEDDIIRSKTVAKVTSTQIVCTYDDGSYCVPCVLMAC